MTPKKKSVVKSETVAAASPAVEAILAKVVRKRAATSASKTAATEAPAPAAAEKKTRTKKSAVAAVEAAVTHRHKKQEFAPATEIAAATPAPAAPAAALSTPVSKQPYEPSHEEVAQLAYSYYVARGYQPGDQAADWFRAVQELKARHAAAASLLED